LRDAASFYWTTSPVAWELMDMLEKPEPNG
jgi:hypothetical protein